MIKLVVEKEIEERHKLLCPNCQHIIDLLSKIKVTEVPGGFHLSIQLSNGLFNMEPKKLIESFKVGDEKLEIQNLNLNEEVKFPFKNFEILER